MIIANKNWGIMLKNRISKFVPIIVLALILFAFFTFGGAKFMNPTNIGSTISQISSWASSHIILASFCSIAIYALCCAIAMPSVAWLTLSSGILFGGLLGGFICACGSTIGAAILYWASSQAFGDGIKAKAGTIIDKFEHSFLRHEFTNLLALRLLPVAPFFAVTIAASAFKVNFRKFVIATFIGILPVEISLAFLGKAFKRELMAGRLPSAHDLLSPSFMLPLIGLAFLALMPSIIDIIKPKNNNLT